MTIFQVSMEEELFERLNDHVEKIGAKRSTMIARLVKNHLDIMDGKDGRTNRKPEGSPEIAE